MCFAFLLLLKTCNSNAVIMYCVLCSVLTFIFLQIAVHNPIECNMNMCKLRFNVCFFLYALSHIISNFQYVTQNDNCLTVVDDLKNICVCY